MAHGHHGGDPLFEQPRGHGGGRVHLGHRGLAGFEEDQRDAVLADQAGEPVGVDEVQRPLLQLLLVAGVFEAQPAQAEPAVVDAVAVEVDDVERACRRSPRLQGLFERGVGGRLEDGEAGEVAEALHRLGQRPGADAVVDVADAVALGVLLRPRADEQDADGQGGRPGGLGLAIGQAPADAHGVLALEQPGAAVVEELPRQRQQLGGRLAARRPGLPRRAFGQIAVHLHREAALGAVGGVLPGGESLAGVLSAQRGLEQILAPCRKLPLDPVRAVLEHAHRPEVVALQIPPQVVRLDGAERRGEGEPPALDARARRSWPARRRAWPWPWRGAFPRAVSILGSVSVRTSSSTGLASGSSNGWWSVGRRSPSAARRAGSAALRPPGPISIFTPTGSSSNQVPSAPGVMPGSSSGITR